jgi:Arf-GAP with coiled-coil, ANK repeat and PH domain-containing protein
MLASVRERKTEYDMPFCFEIAFANVESTIVQAEGQKDFLLWISALRSTIEKRLFSGDAVTFVSPQTQKRPSKLTTEMQRATGRLSFGGSPESTPTVASASAATASTNHQAKRLKNAPLVADILARNPYCAECTRENPEWVSLNLGCAVCIDCSGVHRSMGVHISKMRSLNLDDLEEEEYNLLAAIGECDDCARIMCLHRFMHIMPSVVKKLFLMLYV